jgi:hypothetical protein
MKILLVLAGFVGFLSVMAFFMGLAFRKYLSGKKEKPK